MRPLYSMTFALHGIVLLLAVALTGASPPAHAGGPIGKQKCLAGKFKCVSKKIEGLLKCAEKCQKNPKNCGAKQAECEDKVRFTFERPDQPEKGCFEKLEGKEDPEKPETLCFTLDDTDTMEAQIDALAEDLVGALDGDPPPTCGDGVVNGNESCDGSDLAGADCLTLGYETGTLGCTSGCGYDTTGCAVTCWDVGASVGGGCWFYGNDGQACDTVCFDVNLVYDERTRTFAGSEGTDDNCNRVLAKLAAVGAPVPFDVTRSNDINASGLAIGCSTEAAECPETSEVFGSCWVRQLTTTTAEASLAGRTRACACEEPE